MLLTALFGSRAVMQSEVSESSLLAGRRLVVCPVSEDKHQYRAPFLGLFIVKLS